MRFPHVLLGLAVLATACQTPAPAPPPLSSSPDLAALRARGDAHLALGEHEAAVEAYRQALALDGHDRALRHRLGVALAYMGRMEEAAEAFRWVTANAPAGSDEARIAGQWLAERGGPAASRRDPGAATSHGEDGGRLEGRTEWSDLEPGRPRPSLQLVLEGDTPESRGRRYATRTRLGEPYSFAGVPQGHYRLSAQVGPVRLWDVGVTVKASGPTTLDLLPASSIAAPDALRPRS